MSIYRYRQPSAIDEVTFAHNAAGGVRAYLHTSNRADAPSLYNIICKLQEQDFQCIPFIHEGKPTLEVRGFRNEKKFLDLLEKQNWVQGDPQITTPVTEEIGFADKLRKRSLQGSGWLYAVGDVSFFLYGWKDRSPLDMAAGIFYGLPSPVLMAYGSNDQSEVQVRDIARKMATHLKEASASLPPECSIDSLIADRKKGIIKTADDLLKRYPSEFMNLSYAAAGACIFTAACKHLGTGNPAQGAVKTWHDHLRKTQPHTTLAMAGQRARKSYMLENWLNAGVGATTIASGLFGTLVEEKVRDPDEPEKSGLAGIWEWIRQRPLAVTGTGLMISTLLHAASTAVAMKGQDKEHKKAVPFRAAFVAASLMAELLVAISSKGHGEGVKSDDSVDQSIIAMAAELIARQPARLRESLIDNMGHFLGEPNILAEKDESVTMRLRAAVHAQIDNPWVNCIPISKEPEGARTWQAKIIAPPVPLQDGARSIPA